MNLVVAGVANRGCGTQQRISGDSARTVHERRISARAIPHAVSQRRRIVIDKTGIAITAGVIARNHFDRIDMKTAVIGRAAIASRATGAGRFVEHAEIRHAIAGGIADRGRNRAARIRMRVVGRRAAKPEIVDHMIRQCSLRGRACTIVIDRGGFADRTKLRAQDLVDVTAVEPVREAPRMSAAVRDATSDFFVDAGRRVEALPAALTVDRGIQQTIVAGLPSAAGSGISLCGDVWARHTRMQSASTECFRMHIGNKHDA